MRVTNTDRVFNDALNTFLYMVVLRQKEMFYLMLHLTHFIDSYIPFLTQWDGMVRVTNTDYLMMH